MGSSFHMRLVDRSRDVKRSSADGVHGKDNECSQAAQEVEGLEHQACGALGMRPGSVQVIEDAAILTPRFLEICPWPVSITQKLEWRRYYRSNTIRLRLTAAPA